MQPLAITRIVSGGQSGVDRAALDAARAAGVSCGGWCPRGRRAEDGVIDARYPLRETADADPAARTRANVRDSDGTLIIATRPLTGGTALTRRCAVELGRPCLIVSPDTDRVDEIRAWIAARSIRVLNVAGPRASGDPGVYERALSLLDRLLAARS